MAKIADKYFVTDEWSIIEDGFNPEYGRVAESIFSIANEYMGVRGYFEEGYSGDRLLGSYFNGVYEMTKPEYGHYKGIADFTEYMVNAVDWLYTRINVDGEVLDLAHSNINNYRRVLDFRTGILSRSFVWNTKSGRLQVNFERLVSMTKVNTAAQKITFRALDNPCDIEVTSGLDFSVEHAMQKKNMWDCPGGNVQAGDVLTLSLEGTTLHTDKKVFSIARIDADYEKMSEVISEKITAVKLSLHLEKEDEKSLVKYITNVTHKDHDTIEEYEQAKKAVDMSALDYDSLVSEQKNWWDKVWENSDIKIGGDAENQQGIRFCIFQLFQTYHGAVSGSNIGAKGLTGEAYNGNAFWDTETYCLPFFLFNNKQAAKNLLYFRYATLNEARARAKVLDCEGAYYPIATISGRECCNLWQHASLQLQASTAVAYGIWFYEKLYRDEDFINEYGLEMLIEISRMLASRGDYSADGSRYGYYCVMGPDEFQMMVHNNCYTNYMGKFTLEYTLRKLVETKTDYKDSYSKIVEKLNLREEEVEKWRDIAEKMYIPYYENSQLFEQHEGFFNLPHVDIDAIPITEFPLYSHWSYDRIYRNDMIKQPDVLMLMLLFNSRFSEGQLRANYDYYEPKCIHESSLSPSVHSILAAQLGKDQEAYDFFGFATRMDLDNYNRNTGEGIHTTSIAAAWMNIVYGFGGLRTDGDKLSFAPTIPQGWTDYSFRLTYNDDVIVASVTRDSVILKTANGSSVAVKVYGKDVVIDAKGYSCSIAK